MLVLEGQVYMEEIFFSVFSCFLKMAKDSAAQITLGMSFHS